MVTLVPVRTWHLQVSTVVHLQIKTEHPLQLAKIQILSPTGETDTSRSEVP